MVGAYAIDLTGQRLTRCERSHTRARAAIRPEYMARLLILTAAIGSAHAAMELTPDNFDDVVFGQGKAAFVKFLAPW